jgi:hypothetical protein
MARVTLGDVSRTGPLLARWRFELVWLVSFAAAITAIGALQYSVGRSTLTVAGAFYALAVVGALVVWRRRRVVPPEPAPANARLEPSLRTVCRAAVQLWPLVGCLLAGLFIDVGAAAGSAGGLGVCILSVAQLREASRTEVDRGAKVMIAVPASWLASNKSRRVYTSD